MAKDSKPCPCGSGKKHEQCCKGTKRNNVVDMTDRLLKGKIEEVSDLLWTWINEHAEEITNSFDHGPFAEMLDLEEEIGDIFMDLALEWSLFDDERDGESRFSHFLSTFGSRVGAVLKRELEKWQSSYLSIYIVEAKYVDKDVLILRDMFSDEFRDVLAVHYLEKLEMGDYFLARLLPVGKESIVLRSGLRLSREYAQHTLEEMEMEWFLQEEEEGCRYDTWPQFLKDNSDILISYAVEKYMDHDDGELLMEIEEAYMESVIRDFLCEPMEIFGDKSLLELVNSGDMKGLEIFFQWIEEENENSFHGSMKHYVDAMRDFLGLGPRAIQEVKDFSWHHPSYAREAQVLLAGLQESYLPLDREKALVWWHSYSGKNKPRLRKEGTWAGALEYTLGQNINRQLTFKEMAAKYGVSPPTISKNARQLLQHLWGKETILNERDLIAKRDELRFERYYHRINILKGGIAFTTPQVIQEILRDIDLQFIESMNTVEFTSAQRAQEYIYDAWTTDDLAKRRALAQKALALHEDCADAYEILAETAHEEKRLPLLKEGVLAGERTLAQELSHRTQSMHWYRVETRPYLRLRFALAREHWTLGEIEEARDHFQALLEMDPADHLGIKYYLATVYHELKDYEALCEILQTYDDSMIGEWTYHWVLYHFALGEREKADALLDRAFLHNPFVPGCLLIPDPPPRDFPLFDSLGGMDGALFYGALSWRVWREYPQALDWLCSKIGQYL